jgi:hypothetical protein
MCLRIWNAVDASCWIKLLIYSPINMTLANETFNHDDRLEARFTNQRTVLLSHKNGQGCCFVKCTEGGVGSLLIDYRQVLLTVRRTVTGTYTHRLISKLDKCPKVHPFYPPVVTRRYWYACYQYIAALYQVAVLGSVYISFVKLPTQDAWYRAC